MTKEEILESVSMRDVLDKYGVKVGRNGMCKCPIHNEKNPSMKVYSDGYKCFACGSGGDIFRFVQDMEECDFKTAFKILGGTYTHKKSRVARIVQKSKFDRKREQRLRAEQSEKDFRRVLMEGIDLCRWWLDNRDPLDDDWVYAYNAQQWLWHVFETKYINGEEVNEVNVFRKCKQIRQRFVTV